MRNVEQYQYEPDAEVRQAQFDAERYSIPRYVYQAWRSHRNNALGRGIPFIFPLLRWHLWWKTALTKAGHGAERGNRRGQFMMCRINDAGAYEDGNVYVGTGTTNAADRTAEARLAAVAKCAATMAANGTVRAAHLKVRGDAHPKSKAVVTPAGRFGSIALAAEHHGLTRAGAHYRVKAGASGWRYA